MQDTVLNKEYRHIRQRSITGIAIGTAQYLTGCNKVLLELFHDGEIKYEWFDEAELIDGDGNHPNAGEHASEATTTTAPGGPAPTPPTR